jgi:hypothetical protein
MYQLGGNHLHVTYVTSGLDGQPTMSYQDAHQSKSFRGDELRALECDLGTLVSVTLRMTVDTGSTSLSLFIPRMQIAEGTTAPVHTNCVTTMHRFSVIPQFNQGQLDTYSITALHGTARFAVF